MTRGLIGRYVETYAYADGRLDMRWKGHSLPYRVFDKDQRVTHAAITENKRLSDVLAYKAQQREEWLYAARSQARQTDGFHERSSDHCSTATGALQPRCRKMIA